MLNEFEFKVDLSAIENIKTLSPSQLRIIALEASRQIVKRTGNEGKGSDGLPLKAYSTKPLFVRTWQKPAPKGGKLANVKVKADGTWEPVFERVKAKKVRAGEVKARTLKKWWRYYAGGYKEYRGAMGRTTTPNLYFTGRMLGAFNVITSNDYEARIGFLSAHEKKKAQGLQERGRVFVPMTEAEEAHVLAMVEAALVKGNGLQ